MINISSAIVALGYDKGFSVTGGVYEGIVWNDEAGKPSKEEVLAKQKELQAAYDAQAYARTRQPLYPDIGDQLDDLYKEGAFSASMTAKLKQVKDDNPKG